jgi:biotin carboxylase
MLAVALRAEGADCVAIESSPSIAQTLKFRVDHKVFREVISVGSDLEDVVRRLRPHAPQRVIAGFESGVELAEALAERLSLPVNEPRLRRARRDKFLMIEAVRAAGLAVARQFQSDQVEEIADWVIENAIWPVVVKAPQSVASDLVFLCDDLAAVRRAATTVLSSCNVLGKRNMAVLVQEYLAGIEFAVDVVCHDRQKKTTAIWQYQRPAEMANSVGYDAMVLMPYEGTQQEALQAYAFEVLDALGIRFGPAHCEMIWCGNRPVIVEVGARLTAGNNTILSEICGGISQLHETVASILAPESFLAGLGDRPRLARFAANVFLSPRKPGRLVRLLGMDILQRLPTLYDFSISAKPGDFLDRVAGRVTLVHSDLVAIQRDIATIRQLQSHGFFELA